MLSSDIERLTKQLRDGAQRRKATRRTVASRRAGAPGRRAGLQVLHGRRIEGGGEARHGGGTGAIRVSGELVFLRVQHAAGVGKALFAEVADEEGFVVGDLLVGSVGIHVLDDLDRVVRREEIARFQVVVNGSAVPDVLAEEDVAVAGNVLVHRVALEHRGCVATCDLAVRQGVLFHVIEVLNEHRPVARPRFPGIVDAVLDYVRVSIVRRSLVEAKIQAGAGSELHDVLLVAPPEQICVGAVDGAVSRVVYVDHHFSRLQRRRGDAVRALSSVDVLLVERRDAQPVFLRSEVRARF